MSSDDAAGGTKYGALLDDHEWTEPDPDVDPDPKVEVGTHFLTVNDERDAIERYNGLQWSFVIDDGTITAVDLSHYCPGPGHTDPMGLRSWDDVPGRVKRQALSALNGLGREDEVVDVEAVDAAAEGDWR